MRVTDEMAAEYERLVENWAHPDTRAPEAIRDLLADREEWKELVRLGDNAAEAYEPKVADLKAENALLRRVVEAVEYGRKAYSWEHVQQALDSLKDTP